MFAHSGFDGCSAILKDVRMPEMDEFGGDSGCPGAGQV